MMAVVGTLAFNFHVLLPLLGRFTFEGGALAYTAMAMAMAVGSILGALVTGARGRVSERQLVGACAGFGACALLAAAAPSLPVALAALVPLGAVSVSFAAGVNRDEVREGAEELGVDFDEHVQFVIDAMSARSDELGLGPKES